LSPEAIDDIAKAEHTLEQARGIARAGYYEAAARDSYIVALAAARAIIFDKTAIAVKTHSSVRTQLALLIQRGLDFDPKHARFVNEGFDVKLSVDDDAATDVVDQAKAERFLEQAEAFLAAARAVLK
jgi:uncharacterized protein (UPF0332 family)